MNAWNAFPMIMAIQMMIMDLTLRPVILIPPGTETKEITLRIRNYLFSGKFLLWLSKWLMSKLKPQPEKLFGFESPKLFGVFGLESLFWRKRMVI